MPRGLEGVRKASAEAEARRGQGGKFPQHLYFALKNGEEAEVRFLEQDEDLYWAMMHEVPVEGRHWGDFVPCLDQDKTGEPCPGCERDLPRKFKGFINLIWVDAPVYAREESGKLIKDSSGQKVINTRKDQVAVWTSGIRLFEELDEINANFKGLTSRRFKVKRKGEKLDTKYVIAPADIDSGPQEFSAQEVELADSKIDLNEFINPPSYEEFLAKLGEGGGQQQQNGGGSEERVNPFMRNRS